MTSISPFERLVAGLRGQPSVAAGLEVHVVGLTGTEGAAVARLIGERLGSELRVVGHDFAADRAALAKSFEGAHVAVDKAARKEGFLALMDTPGLELRCGERYLTGTDGADLVFTGQNWRAYSANHPRLDALRERVEGAQMIDLYMALAPAGLVGITGTNGKTTSCNWLLDMAGRERSARVSGNDLLSRQALGELDALAGKGLLILEVSNRQARDMRASAPVVAVTSLAPDHVSEHGGFEAYIAAKRRLIELQGPQGVAILNRDDAAVRAFAKVARGRVLWASSSPLPDALEGAFVDSEGTVLLRRDGVERALIARSELSLPGPHNLTNGLLAALCADISGVNEASIIAGLKGFKGVKNRLQLVGRRGDVRYYNDLASTSPWATLAALESFEGGLQLIVGGSVKAQQGYDQLAQQIARRVRRLILLPSEVSERLSKALPADVPRVEATSIDEAVRLAAEGARAGERVLLSPAGAGFYSRFLGKAGSFNRSVRALGRRSQVA